MKTLRKLSLVALITLTASATTLTEEFVRTNNTIKFHVEGTIDKITVNGHIKVYKTTFKDNKEWVVVDLKKGVNRITLHGTNGAKVTKVAYRD